MRRTILTVANLRRSKRFYRDLLRLEILWETSDTIVWASNGAELLLQEGRPETKGLQLEIALKGQEQMKVLAKKVTESELGSFDAADATVTHVSFTDPDGYHWMVKELSNKES